MKLLSDNLALITGVANKNSIAWAIARAAHQNGAKVVLSYQNERLEKRVRPLAEEIDATPIQCDFTNEKEVEALFKQIEEMGVLRYAVHSIAFSDKSELTGNFTDTSRNNFHTTMDVSVYTFMVMVHHCKLLMSKNDVSVGERGSIIGLTYGASTRPHPHYNVMAVAKAGLEAAMKTAALELGPKSIRVNALSPSPVETLSARGIGDFHLIGEWAEGMSMLGRRATLEEIANAAIFLLSDKSSGIVAHTLMVDCGASVTGMPSAEHAHLIARSQATIADKAAGVTRLPDKRGEFLDHAGSPETDEDPAPELQGATTLSG